MIIPLTIRAAPARQKAAQYPCSSISIPPRMLPAKLKI